MFIGIKRRSVRKRIEQVQNNEYTGFKSQRIDHKLKFIEM